MCNLAFKLLLSRKKWLILLIMSFALIISSIVAIYSSTETIKSNLLARSFQQFGEFSGVLLNISNENKIKKSSSNYGEYKLFDSYTIKDNIILNIGWADNNFFNIGHISLKSGKLPMATHEVAIESFYLDTFDPTWKLNQIRTIKIGTKEISLKLVGIVENYSSRWVIQNNYYPNMFLFNSDDISNNIKSNYLIAFKQNYSISKNIEFVQNLLGENEGSVINDRLLFTGLNDYEKITVLSVCLQIIILIVSSLCILTMLSFFNVNQRIKFAIFKSLGCSNNRLYLISILQTTYVYFGGILASTPLVILLHFLIIKHTYGFAIINKNSITGILIGTTVWLLILYILITLLSFLTIKKSKKSSISKGMQAGGLLNENYSNKLNYFKSFTLKQLTIQIFSHPKTSILSTLTLSFSILLILFSVTVAKESQGIWNTKIEYYLDSQQLVSTKMVDGHTVVANKGLTYSPDEVRKIESLKGIAYIDKSPYMLEVHPIINKDLLTSSLISWIDENKFANTENVSNDTIMIPNVKYVLKTTEELSKLTSNSNKEELQNLIVIHIPGIKAEEKEKLEEQSIELSKTSLSVDKLTTSTWKFKIAKIIDTPYKADFDVTSNINNEITIILDEQTAIDYGITQGYKQLMIYTEENLSKEESKIIYDKIYGLTVGVPGSLFQYIPELIFDRTRITEFLDFLGSFSFYISLTLSILSISMVIFGKYRLQKRYWGIYRSLGLSTNKLFYYLILELSVYYILAIIISSILYFIYLFLNRLDYPLYSYLLFFTSTIFTVLLVLIVSAIIIRGRISNDSISELLKIEE
ncbi:FtsX-like permease family protein [Paenibacillus oryzisoli]|uniref:hypothetical protein n=1 Tax=Paenibacillus oryzisoli TaxID=1850517 RepID=UPI003D276219